MLIWIGLINNNRVYEHVKEDGILKKALDVEMKANGPRGQHE
jgi:hypothetical protein